MAVMQVTFVDHFMKKHPGQPFHCNFCQASFQLVMACLNTKDCISTSSILVTFVATRPSSLVKCVHTTESTVALT